MSKVYCIYIMANNRPTLYIGVSNNLLKRVYEHKHGLVSGFTKTYRLHKLVYFEQTASIVDVIRREKQLKNWHRQWKLNLIAGVNPSFRDLYPELVAANDPETSLPAGRQVRDDR